MKRPTITAFALVLLVLVFYPQQFSQSGGAIGQRRRVRKTAPASAPQKGTIDYSRFSHATKEHTEACKTCHQSPTANSAKVRGFPDVADFPDHGACVRCHRQQFFKGVQPIICTDCHTKTSARNDERWEFRNPKRPQQFTIEFPHDKHQDVIASLRLQPETSVRGFIKSAHAADDRTRKYNNCTICHAHPRALVPPVGGWTDAYVPAADTFKSAPTSHDLCFNCHWQGQEPTRENCAGCHKSATAAYVPAGSPKRFSMKFRHDGGGAKQNHPAECTTCHINITKSTTLRGLKPDVPITSCTECHNKDGLRQDLNNELAAIDKNKNFVCSYCHTSDVGKRDAPASHYRVAERPPLKRADLK